jgi:predicted nucleic acid-binding protein
VIVVDASALALALLDDGPLGEDARDRLTADPHWVVPAHLLVEVISAIQGKVMGGKITTKRGDDAIVAVAELTIDQVDLSGLVPRMWELRENLSPYDAAYVAAAEALGCPLVTGDAKLGRAAGRAALSR